MKWIKSNGKVLLVRDVGEPLVVLRAADVPLPIIDEIMTEDAARRRLRSIIRMGVFRREK